MRQWTIDAFASAPFMGNPAAVLAPFDAWPETAWLQAMAAENNLSETAYLLKTDDPTRFDLRWFTPTLEMPLCGHATLASAHMLFFELGLTAPVVTFDTKSGPLKVRRLADDRMEMDLPARPPQRIETPAGLGDALGTPVLETWASQYVLAIVADEAIVRALNPNIPAIEALCKAPPARERGNLIVAAFCAPDAPYDMVSRFFAPGSGIAEDPATGSAHCILAPLFADVTGKKAGQFYQAFPGRGAEIGCEVVGTRVLLRGNAVTILEAKLRL